MNIVTAKVDSILCYVRTFIFVNVLIANVGKTCNSQLIIIFAIKAHPTVFGMLLLLFLSYLRI